MSYNEWLEMLDGGGGIDSDDEPYEGYDDRDELSDGDFYESDEYVIDRRRQLENEIAEREKQREHFLNVQRNLLKGVCNNADEFSRVTGTMYENRRYSDVTLAVGKQKFYAHRLVLSAWSDVFKTMLCNSSWQQSDDQPNSECQDLFEEECCEEVFSDFLKFLYSASIDLTKANVLPLTLLADKYLVTELRELCDEFIRDKQNDVQEVISFIHSASQFGMSETVQFCLKSLLCNFNVLTTEQLLSLQAEHLKYLLDSGPSLVVDDEYTLFKKIEPWLDQCQSEDILLDVIKLIRFPYMNALQLKKARETPAFRRAQGVVPDILLKAWQQQALYNEASLKDLPDDFPWPRMYIYSNDEASSKDRTTGSSRVHTENKLTKIRINDGRSMHTCIPWRGKRIDQKQIFTHESTFRFYIKVTRSSSLSDDVIIQMETDEVPQKRCHVGVRAQVLTGKPSYFYKCFPPVPSSVEKSSSAYEESSRTTRSTQFKYHTGVVNPVHDTFSLFVAVILEDKDKGTQKEACRVRCFSLDIVGQ